MPPNGGIPAWSDLEPAVFQAIFSGKENKDLPLYVVVEKILGPEEPLPAQWPAAGSTGYDFLRTVNGLFVDWKGLHDLKRVFDRFVGRPADFREVVHDSKLTILRGAMSSELQLLARRLNRLSERHRRFRDYTLNMLRHALREIIACFAVYRTYLRPQEISERDRRFVFLRRGPGQASHAGIGRTGVRLRPRRALVRAAGSAGRRRQPRGANCSSAASSRLPAP